MSVEPATPRAAAGEAPPETHPAAHGLTAAPAAHGLTAAPAAHGLTAAPAGVRGALWGAAVLGVLSLAGFVALTLYFVRTEAGQVADERLRWAVGVPGNTRSLLNAGLDLVSVTHIVIVLLVLLAIGVARRRMVLSLVAAGFVSGVIVLSQVLKYWVIQRPSLGHPPANSLPSGHVTVLTSCVLAAILVSAPRWRRWLVLAGTVVATFAGMAVVINSWHRVSDVVAAYCLCAFWAACCAIVGLRTRLRGRPEDERPRIHGARRLFGYLLISAIAGTAVILFLRSEGMTVARTWGTADWGLRTLVLIVGSCVLMMAGVATLADHLGNGAAVGAEPVRAEGRTADADTVANTNDGPDARPGHGIADGRGDGSGADIGWRS